MALETVARELAPSPQKRNIAFRTVHSILSLYLFLI